MSASRSALALVFLAAAPVWAGPGSPAAEAPDVDWLAGNARVLGVGTPKILSPTGSLLERDAIELAREDAFARMRRLLRSLPRPEGAPKGADPLAAAGERAPSVTFFTEPVFFSDGSAHMTATVSLAAAVGHPVPPATARVERLAAPAGFTPCIQLRLEDATGRAVFVGLPGDGIPHLRYRAPAAGWVGAAATTSPRACTLRRADALPAADVLEVSLP